MKEDNLKVFISYSWDSEEHKEWVRKLADYLTENAIEVILDQYDLAVGHNMTHFMEAGIERADKVLIILTPEYKRKATDGRGGASFEHSIISSRLFRTQHNNDKFIPVLRVGDTETSAPGYLQTLLFHDMSNDQRFLSDAFTLLRILYDEPALVKPEKGIKPNLNVVIDPILEEAKNLAAEVQIVRKRDAFADSHEAIGVVGDAVMEFYKTINAKAEEYKETGLHIRSNFNENRVVLNINGVGLKAGYFYNYHRKLEDNELNISVWDKPILTDQNQYYFPGEEPQLLQKITFKPHFNNKLELQWISSSTIVSTNGLVGFCYSTLFEFIRRKS